jgi:hypothetical protein
MQMVGENHLNGLKLIKLYALILMQLLRAFVGCYQIPSGEIQSGYGDNKGDDGGED